MILNNYKVGPTIMTYSGTYVDFVHPERSVYNIEDVAHSLSNICRFTGHVRHHYSVAQHCDLVSRLVPEPIAMLGLMHDGPEFALGDVSTPLKQLLPDYKKIEHEFEADFFPRFGLQFPFPPDIKLADRIALATEKRDLMSVNKYDPEIWDILKGITPHPEPIRKMTPKEAKKLFLDRYWELMGKGH